MDKNTIAKVPLTTLTDTGRVGTRWDLGGGVSPVLKAKLSIGPGPCKQANEIIALQNYQHWIA